jgi:4,5-DOPA dioxygenase extradiol
MPAIFIGHGSPMNAISDNRFSSAWRELGRSLPRPRAILAISAHWYIPNIAVSAAEKPGMIYNLGWYPQEIYNFKYPAPGSPALAAQICELLKPLPVELNEDRGFDHGTWSVLAHLFPDADIPVVQLSIDRRQPPLFHYELGQKLASLRDDGIIVVASGNIVHNLTMLKWGYEYFSYDWAVRFEKVVKQLLLQRDHAALIDYPGIDPQAMFAVPTPEHYLPLLYIIGAQQADESASFPVAGIDEGSLSMLSVVIDRATPGEESHA